MKRHLFVCGCPRSGTTALQQLLGSHPKIVLGVERFFACSFAANAEGLGPHLFTKERFFDIRPGDTHYGDFSRFGSYYQELAERFDDATWVGDKSPPFVHLLDHIERRFEAAHVVVIMRDAFDVASSFQVRANNENDPSWGAHRDYALAVREWNDANRLTLAFLEKPERRTGLTIVSYDDVFGNHASIANLFDRLGLDYPTEVRDHYQNLLERGRALTSGRKTVLTADQLSYVAANADHELAAHLLKHRMRVDRSSWRARLRGLMRRLLTGDGRRSIPSPI